MVEQVLNNSKGKGKYPPNGQGAFARWGVQKEKVGAEVCYPVE